MDSGNFQIITNAELDKVKIIQDYINNPGNQMALINIFTFISL